ncbi:MAG: long-chain fatty acid--CoA ligase [Alphaproteobacteria bacterium]|jgi:fatty-acyl-CoA synthase|nr:long-chain fatty acid--CoA ligase [Alphaproteobacteria bacterium]MBT4084503.1 long-chain fatty acid--CoA ligase [Alphaproteobacteria bacterium]MBT4545690.1 long-chain fatty acid--CoA ligase [Alphaproteobacteria bacterium]MBT7748124.1 long-chain fatty acid--CoA ligase [Alphaproteobacteria bacterium]
MDISSWVDHHAAFTPEKVAIRFEGTDYTWADLARRVARLSAVLRNELSVKTGDRVGYLGLNSPELVALFFACARIGAITVPLNWRLTLNEHQVMIADFEPRVLFVEPDYYDHAIRLGKSIGNAELVGMSDVPAGWFAYHNLKTHVGDGLKGAQGAGPDSPLLICYTSGATGAPKGAILNQNAFFFNAINSTHMHELTSQDRVLTNLPMFHVGGLNILTFPAFHIGATVIMHPAFDVEATLDAIEREAITLTVLVPAQIDAMMAHPKWSTTDFSSLRVVDTGSTFVADKLILGLQERGVAVGNIYGCTETAPIATALTRHDTHKVGSVGKAALHCEIRLVDDDGNDVPQGVSGEILVRGPNLMTGYWNQPELSAEVLKGGWYHTADMAHADEEGFLYIDDRKKDMIISGGENIYPAELENVLAEYDALAEAAVVGKRHDKWGEVPVVFAVAKLGISVAKPDILELFVDVLAHFKHPKEVIFVDALPRNAMGKILKHELRDMIKD